MIRAETVPGDTGKRAGNAPLAAATRDYSASNVVSVLLGQEGIDDGVGHLANEADGRTTIESLDGVPCRYLNRRAEKKAFGYLYFVIHPDFKHDGLQAARIEIEYFVGHPGVFRIQYDAMEGETHRPYKAATFKDGESATLGSGTQFMRFRGSNGWQTATFHVTDGAFANAQNGGADFRLEVTPPEIHVRRVSVTRETVQPPQPQGTR